MKKLVTIMAALAVSISFATAADAEKKEGKNHHSEEMFKKLDTNSDGFLSLEEFKAGPAGKKDAAKVEEMFKKRDTNNDGKLSLEEFMAGHKEKKAEEAAPAAPGTAAPAPAAAK